MKIKQILFMSMIMAILSLQSTLVVAAEPVSMVTKKASAIQWMGTVTLSSGNLNIRKGPSTNDKIIGKLPNGSEVEVMEHSSNWAKISFNGSSAYVAKPFLVIRQEKVNLNKKIIVLDPGHGGKDSGAIAKDGTYESKLVWQYTVRAKEMLEKSGYIVYLTRGEKSSCTPYKNYEDELICRAQFAKKVKGDIFISIHADANNNKKYRGTITFYNARNDWDGNQNPYSAESKSLAQSVHSHIQPVIGSKDRGIENKNYFVNRMNSVPSVLIELAYMTNSADLKLLKDKKKIDKFSKSLVQAVDHYYSH
jgi:N-acetylmuramoyl-L-alanine amidase